MRSTLALLLLFGSVIGLNAGPCTTDELPVDGPCEHDVDVSKETVKSDLEARAWCMKFYPTTFLTGRITSARNTDEDRTYKADSNGNIQIKCSVEKHEVCKLYEVPQEKPCQITINWKVHNANEATSVCLEYFPTTFVKGEISQDRLGNDLNTIRCTVQAAYQCVEPDTFLMFDKCYSFPKKSTNPVSYVENTINKYMELFVAGDPTKGRKLCNGGKLSVFYSHTHAKFLGMKANSLGINKLWIGINKDGTSIEEPDRKIHSKLWKLIEGDYWDLNAQGKPELKRADPNKIKYYFLRTRNDQFNNRFQGSFEQATEKIEATFACEFEAKFTKHQKWYCDKLREMGMDSQFDLLSDSKPRCIYVSANKYSWTGDVADMSNIKGCQEKPSDLHSAGLDDGTGAPKMYEQLTHKGKLRLAGHLNRQDQNGKGWGSIAQKKCKEPVVFKSDRQKLFMQWAHLEHKGKSKIAATTSLEWDKAYPKNECSDFPGESTTLGVKGGKMIDMPQELRAPAVCSLIFFQECESKSPCSGKLECKNMQTFQAVTWGKPNKGFFTCQCPEEGRAHEAQVPNGVKTCDWKGSGGSCAWFEYAIDVNSEFFPVQSEFKFIGEAKNDLLMKAVVKDQCKLSVLVHGPSYAENYLLLNEAGYGTHEVPNKFAGTLGGELQGMGASSMKCTC